MALESFILGLGLTLMALDSTAIGPGKFAIIKGNGPYFSEFGPKSTVFTPF